MNFIKNPKRLRILDGKFVKRFSFTEPGVIEKIAILPSKTNLHRMPADIAIYRSQLKNIGVPVTELISVKFDSKFNALFLKERYYPKCLELEFFRSSASRALFYFKNMLAFLESAYPDNSDAPLAVVELKPSNFVGSDDFFYCDFIPPRILRNGKLPLWYLDFPLPVSKSKVSELERRFLTREGSLEYLFIHCAAIRPNLVKNLLDMVSENIGRPSKKKLSEKIKTKSFVGSFRRLEEFYRLRRDVF